MDATISTLLDVRVPQPGREAEYGVPDYLVEAAAVLYRCRNTAPDADVDVIDAAIMRLYAPYIREAGRGSQES